MEQILGKLNNDAYMIRYRGTTTDTAKVTVDNAKSTIAVDVMGFNDFKQYVKDNYYSKREINALLNNIRDIIKSLATKEDIDEIDNELVAQKEEILSTVNNILTNYATTSYVNNKLTKYVTDVPSPTISDDKVYGRQHGEWVELRNIPQSPTIDVFTLPELLNTYKYGEIVDLTKIVHKESHLESIDTLTLFKNDISICGLNASSVEVEDIISDRFVATEDFTYSLVANGAQGSAIVTLNSTVDSTPYMYTGISLNSTITDTDLDNFTYEEIIEDKKYKYNVENLEYVYWCTPFEISEIRQDGLYPITFVKVGEVNYNNLHLNCYRTEEGLVSDLWRFTVVLNSNND